MIYFIMYCSIGCIMTEQVLKLKLSIEAGKMTNERLPSYVLTTLKKGADKICRLTLCDCCVHLWHFSLSRVQVHF
jgi:hypothetical protein